MRLGASAMASLAHLKLGLELLKLLLKCCLRILMIVVLPEQAWTNAGQTTFRDGNDTTPPTRQTQRGYRRNRNRNQDTDPNPDTVSDTRQMLHRRHRNNWHNYYARRHDSSWSRNNGIFSDGNWRWIPETEVAMRYFLRTWLGQCRNIFFLTDQRMDGSFEPRNGEVCWDLSAFIVDGTRSREVQIMRIATWLTTYNSSVRAEILSSDDLYRVATNVVMILGPAIILRWTWDDGLMYLTVENLGDTPNQAT